MTITPLPRPSTLDADDQRAYALLTTHAVHLPTDARWLELIGEKATDALNGLITNDVTTLPERACMRAAALTPKGKVLADLLVIRRSGTALDLVMDRASADAFTAMARKYVNPRLATLRDTTEAGRSWWLIGGAASALAEEAPEGVIVMSCDVFAPQPSVLVYAPTTHVDAAARWLAAGAVGGSVALREVLRVEAGQPAVGVDMDDGTIPQEANLDTLGAISFTKGCYTGQETVARVHFRGHVNRHLLGLRAAAPIVGGATVLDSDGKPIGDVRSTVWSPRFGAIALGMIRREVAPGSVVRIQQGDEPPVEATVTDLPFVG